MDSLILKSLSFSQGCLPGKAGVGAREGHRCQWGTAQPAEAGESPAGAQVSVAQFSWLHRAREWLLYRGWLSSGAVLHPAAGYQSGDGARWPFEHGLILPLAHVRPLRKEQGEGTLHPIGAAAASTHTTHTKYLVEAWPQGQLHLHEERRCSGIPVWSLWLVFPFLRAHPEEILRITGPCSWTQLALTVAALCSLLSYHLVLPLSSL